MNLKVGDKLFQIRTRHGALEGYEIEESIVTRVTPKQIKHRLHERYEHTMRLDELNRRGSFGRGWFVSADGAVNAALESARRAVEVASDELREVEKLAATLGIK